MSSRQIGKQKQPFHTYKTLRLQVIPVSPSEAETPLQIVCFFDQTKNEIPAKKLLLIGLGDPDKFSAQVMRAVGHVAMNEAVKLGVSSFSFAPSIKDAGVSSVPAGDVSTLLTEGMLKAYNSAATLVERGLMSALEVNEIIFLAGAAHIADSQAGLAKAIKANSHR